jgi:hypothetical protein
MQNALMPRLLFVSLLIFSANMLVAQKPATISPKPETIQLPAGTLPVDPAKLAASIRDSYYHPDNLSSLDCTLSIDWPAFFTALKSTPSEDRLKILQGVKIRSRAVRGKSPEITFDWTAGPLSSSEQLESGLKQTLGGFYQIYWPMVASSVIKDASELAKIEPLPNGGANVHMSDHDTKVDMTVDKESAPTHYTLDSPAMKGTIDLHYTPTPNPVPGDIRRISSLDLSEQVGTSIMNLGLSLDYQVVDGFFVPKHAAFNISGAYTLNMEFTGCSVSK